MSLVSQRPELAAPRRERFAGVAFLRAACLGLGFWLLVPPVSLENVLRAVIGTAPIVTFWWYYRGPGRRHQWWPASLFGLLTVVSALMFSRVLLIAFGEEGSWAFS